MTTSCHADFKWICVTPLPYDQNSTTWPQVKTHLQGIWHDTMLGPDLKGLHTKITEISQAYLTAPGSEIADRIWKSIQESINPVMWWSSLIHIGITGLIILILILVFPVVFRVILSSLRKTTLEFHHFRLKNKKEGNATSTAASTVGSLSP